MLTTIQHWHSNDVIAVNITFLMIFAVFGPSPLTVCINCIFFFAGCLAVSWTGTLYTMIHKNVEVHFWKILIDFNNIYISGNGNECPLQMRYLLIYFTCDVNMTSLSLSISDQLRPAATASAACVTRLRAVADWWRSWPMANRLACLCSCQRWTFWTYLVTVNLFSLMNIMFDTTLDGVGNILRVHCRSWKSDVLFSQGSVVSTLFRWGENVFFMYA